MTRKLQRGMTLVELLVAMAIGVGVVFAVSTLLVAGQNHKRTTTSTNDADQTGNYTFHALDTALRSAGSSIAQSASAPDQGVLGCLLNAGTNAGGVFLPRTTPFPAPFATAFLNGSTATLAVAPVLIGAGQSDNSSSDVLVVMGGSGSAGGVTRPIYGAGSTTSLVLQNTVGFNAYDIALVSQSGITNCLLEEVSTAIVPGTALPLAKGAAYRSYYTAGSPTTLATLAASLSSAVTPLGNAASNNVQFQLFGVGTNDVLYSYDLLQNQNLIQGSGPDISQAIADGVIQMNAIYGVATAAKPTVFNNWANPNDTTHHLYDINSVMSTPGTMKSIIAVRVAIVVRGEYYDKNVVSPASLTIFKGLKDGYGAPLDNHPVSLTGSDGFGQHYRYRVFEFTVPLRNMIVLAGGV